MIVSKDKRLKNKISLDDEHPTLCSVCRKKITAEDVETNNFEYCKTKLGENFAHSSCVNKLIKHK